MAARAALLSLILGLIVCISPVVGQQPRVTYPSGNYTDVASVIRSWYRRYFGRETEPGGLQGWSDEIRRGKSLRDVQTSLLASSEYYALKGGRPDTFIRGLFRDELGRIPTSPELDYWLRRLRKHNDKRSRLVGDFLSWAEQQAQVAPQLPSSPVDLVNQLVQDTSLLVESTRQELAGTQQGRQVLFRINALAPTVNDLARFAQLRINRPDQFAFHVTQVDRALTGVEESLSWLADTAPNTFSVARRMRTCVQTLQGQGPGVGIPPVGGNPAGYDIEELDEELDELGEEIEAAIRQLRYPIRLSYFDNIVLRDLTAFAGQVADMRSHLWDQATLVDLNGAFGELQRRCQFIAGRLGQTSQPAAMSEQWRDVERQMERVGRGLGPVQWPGNNPSLPGQSLIALIDQIIAEVDVFLESLSPVLTSYPDAFWVQAESRRLRANLLLLRELGVRGANPSQLQGQLQRVLDGYQRIQQRIAGSRRSVVTVHPLELSEPLTQLRQSCARP